MKINVNSWHYRMWEGTFPPGSAPESTDLCRYCHKVFWALFWKASAVFLLVLCVVGLVLLMGVMIIAHPLKCLLFVLALSSALTLIYLYNIWLDKTPTVNSSKTVNPALAWVSARKTKVCPLIEFKGED